MELNRLTNPEAYKKALAGLLRRGTEVTDYIATAPEKAGQAILEGHERNKALQAQAFANPNRPFQVTDANAMSQLGDRMLAGPLSVAPVGMIAYHGTPHLIKDKFDISKVGTGEGAQAYGHGMYFAESPSVAETYKKAGGGLEVKYNKPLEELGINADIATKNMDFSDPLNQGLGRIAKRLRTTTLDYPDVPVNKSLVKEHFDEYIRLLDDKYPQDAAQKKALQDLVAKEGYPDIGFGGNLYKVDIPDEHIPMMLDWDKPLREQPKLLKTLGFDVKKYDKLKAQREAMPEKFDIDIPKELAQYEIARKLEKQMAEMPVDISGKYFYESLIKKYGNQKAISDALAEKGVKGIRYLDAGSRGKAAERSSNFVVFDPSDVKLLERNNQPLTRKEILQEQLDKIAK